MSVQNFYSLLWALGLLCLAQFGFALEADQVFDLASPSVVRVIATVKAGSSYNYGSGVVTSPATVITNCHVVDKGKDIKVSTQKLDFAATVKFADRERDLCQLSVPGLPAPAVKLPDTPKVRVGQRVYAIGNPEGLELTLSDGLVSGIRGKDPKRLIQISAPITHGSSGGGLFDVQGRLIGITNAGVKEGLGLNFAIPVEYIPELTKKEPETKAPSKTAVAPSSVAPVTASTASPGATNPTSTDNKSSTNPDTKSTSEVRKLTYEEIMKHFTAGRVLLVNEGVRGITLDFPRSGREIHLYCEGCNHKSHYARLMFKSTLNQVCFQWGWNSYAPVNDGCFEVTQFAEGKYRMDPVRNGSSFEYRVTK